MSDNTQQETQKPLRKVRIQNDGKPGYATRITDAETGQPIDNIYHAKVVDIDVHDVPRVLLWAHSPVIDVVGDAETVDVCPLCKARKNVEPTEDNKEVWRHKIKFDIDDTNVAYSIERLRALQREHDELARQSIGPAEAITAFMTWLTTREEVSGPFYAGSPEVSDEAMKLVEKFCQSQGWHIKNEKYTELIRHVVEDDNFFIAEQ